MRVSCRECGREFLAEGARGRTPVFCGATCRKRVNRRRWAGVSFPVKMTSLRQWARAEGGRPLKTSGAMASPSRPASWASFAEVQQGPGDSFGFMVGGGVGAYVLAAAAHRGRVDQWARAVLSGLPEPVIYAEVSPAGDVVVFVLAGEGPGSRQVVSGGVVERFSRGRFVVVTGERIELKELIGNGW